MLFEDQVAELLTRAEKNAGRRFSSTRGNLRNPENRAAAVWELVCIDVFSNLGSVSVEPDHGSKPDIVLSDASGAEIWVEVAFLYPRAWKNERKAHDLSRWIYTEVEARGVPLHKVSVHIDRERTGSNAPLVKLPEQHEKKEVLRSNALVEFFQHIVREPAMPTEAWLRPYTVKVAYDPSDQGPHVHGSGVEQESPQNLKQHALFRTLEEKKTQHDPSVPYVVCVGSDQSPVPSRMLPDRGRGVGERDVISALFTSSSRVSAVVVVSIESEIAIERAHLRRAHTRLYLNPRAKHPLSEKQTELLRALDFNRWKYTFQLDKNGIHGAHRRFRSKGDLSLMANQFRQYLTIPATALMDCLAGRTTLDRDYSISRDAVFRCISEGWDIVGCKFEQGDIQQGVAATVTLELVPPPERVFRE